MIIETDNYLFDNKSFVVTKKNGEKVFPSLTVPFLEELELNGVDPFTTSRPFSFEPEIGEGYKVFYWPKHGLIPLICKNEYEYLSFIFKDIISEPIKDVIFQKDELKIMCENGRTLLIGIYNNDGHEDKKHDNT